MLKGLFILDDFNLIYGSVHEEIKKYIDVYAEPQTKESIQQNPALLADTEVIFSGWGCPVLDDNLLMAAPHLKALFYGAGSIKHITTDAFWERGIPITSAFAANAVPVVEYTLSQILFSLKQGWSYVLKTKKEQKHIKKMEVPGAYHSTVGIVSLGMIGRKVCEILKQFDVHVIAYDPFVSKEDAEKLQVELCSLEELFQRSDVVSLHTPWIKETVGLINGELISLMKHNATLINTSRGAVVNEQEMIEVLKLRSDLFAVLDVTYPEPPIDGSPLFTMDNVILTPHIAGSLSQECQRMGEYMLDELKLYLQGKPLQWEITREKALIMA
ncbi:hydroxyacid dehydrogenase [Lederbergia lenta]|uniref:D-3-phosphoglycerate dehydrogenase n=1 Tax=Lederbergia lenta TaxID=1467 RepID=A0A2X4W799_LEDLE|nr:hydroxyacid dehydrogenase [Lederbergia lenta]MEC2324625.1 hydroxyacid dehydrogenase [Lederbergia lenta]SQI59021.1 D-3-phosphoglycerate dehydrogenase [Lederbergia lenta]